MCGASPLPSRLRSIENQAVANWRCWRIGTHEGGVAGRTCRSRLLAGKGMLLGRGRRRAMGSKRVRRVFRLIALLQSGHGCDVSDLAHRLRVSRRTIFRDFKVLEAAGIPCHYDTGTNGYSISQDFFLPVAPFTLAEATVLLLLLRKFAAPQIVPDFDAVESAAAKTENLMAIVTRQRAQKVVEGIDMHWRHAADVRGVIDVFDAVKWAIVLTRKVRVTYVDALEGTQDVLFHPYRLAFVAGAWHAIGFSESQQTVRALKVTRISKIDFLGEPFVRDKAFNPDDYCGNAWDMVPEGRIYKVAIRFGPTAADDVKEVTWHHTQRTRRLADGSLRFEADVDGLNEITRWVLSYGSQAVVERPPELVERVLSQTRNTLANYGATTEDALPVACQSTASDIA